MATTNGDIKSVETAETFARGYLDDLFNNNKNLGAFEEETLDLNIKSKYDDLKEEDAEEFHEPKTNNHSSTNAESSHVEHETHPHPESVSVVEPDQQTFKVNGHVEIEAEPAGGAAPLVVSQSEVPEPSQVEFAPQSVEEVETHSAGGSGTAAAVESVHNGEAEVLEPGVSHYSAQVEVEAHEPVIYAVKAEPEEEFVVLHADQVDQHEHPEHHVEEHHHHVEASVSSVSSEHEVSIPEPSSTAQFQPSAEEAEEEDDVVAPIPSSRQAKPGSSEEQEEFDLKFKKLGLSKNWWDSKRNETETQKDQAQPVDKFRTIKQNIKRGNTRSLMLRFENLAE